MTLPKIEDVGHGKPIMPFGSDGTNWYAFLIDVLGHLQVDVVSAALGSGAATETTLLLIKGYVDALETLLAGGLPAALDTGALKTKEQSPLTGFATSANQTTMITALQLIDDLRNALGSVNTDDLQVDVKTYPGINAYNNIPFGYYNRYVEQVYTPNATAGDNILSGTPVPAGEVWIIQAISAININKAISINMGVSLDGVRVYSLSGTMSAANVWLSVAGQWVMKEGDFVSVVFANCTLNDDIYFRTGGYKMKVA